MRIMFLLVLAIWFFSFSYVFPAALGSAIMRTDETVYFLYTQPCVSGRVRKTNRPCWPAFLRARDIRVYRFGFSRPIVCRSFPRHRTYSTEVTSLREQSPASSHNTPVLSHTRLNNITERLRLVKRIFVIFAENFGAALWSFYNFLKRPISCGQAGGGSYP